MMSQDEIDTLADVPKPKPTSIVARFKCSNVTKLPSGEQSTLHAVYSDDPEHPNHQWSKYTPAGSLSINISNPAAMGLFEIGKEYELLVTQVLPR